jgi:hypothetical protein
LWCMAARSRNSGSAQFEATSLLPPCDCIWAQGYFPRLKTIGFTQLL